MKLIKPLLVALITLSLLSAAAQEKKTVVLAPEKRKSAKGEKTFNIIEKGSLLSKVSFRRDVKASGNVIEIEAVNTSGGSVSLGNSYSGKGAVRPPATITDIISLQGNYLQARDISNSGRGVVRQLLDVTYPYRVRMNISNQALEFEITEPGFWKVSIAVSE
jgi:hypothetical protein